MEDGFLRSVHLGSDLAAPGSLVVDRSGIYYDPGTASELETLLENSSFSGAELRQAERLRRRIVEAGISKYNPSRDAMVQVTPKPGQRVVFVPGQVPGDASVRLGSSCVHDDRELLQAVRALCPDAFLIYKPHPDVLSGNRRGSMPDRATGLWDELIERSPISACLQAADEVHTMTSLVGFEALLRGLRVVTHGQPFYAGWGLTEDRQPIGRRCRRLTLDELVAGTLVRYPRYYSWRARAFCTAEDMVEELIVARDQQRRWLARAPRFLRGLGNLGFIAREWTRAA
jgi:capsular polysaccharide export protein